MGAPTLYKRLSLPVGKTTPNPFQWTKIIVFKPDGTHDQLKKPYAENKVIKFVSL